MRETYVTVVELPAFARRARAAWTEAENETFVTHIACNPDAGDIIPETGGVRKIRWSRAGMGKRGGVRVIYYYHDKSRPLITLYAKNRQETLSAREKSEMRKFAEAVKKGEP
jgi:hypothetical protein